MTGWKPGDDLILLVKSSQTWTEPPSTTSLETCLWIILEPQHQQRSVRDSSSFNSYDGINSNFILIVSWNKHNERSISICPDLWISYILQTLHKCINQSANLHTIIRFSYLEKDVYITYPLITGLGLGHNQLAAIVHCHISKEALCEQSSWLIWYLG